MTQSAKLSVHTMFGYWCSCNKNYNTCTDRSTSLSSWGFVEIKTSYMMLNLWLQPKAKHISMTATVAQNPMISLIWTRVDNIVNKTSSPYQMVGTKTRKHQWKVNYDKHINVCFKQNVSVPRRKLACGCFATSLRCIDWQTVIGQRE